MFAISILNRACFCLQGRIEVSAGGNIGIASIVVEWDGDTSHNPER
jgi:hypothetical protein